MHLETRWRNCVRFNEVQTPTPRKFTKLVRAKIARNMQYKIFFVLSAKNTPYIITTKTISCNHWKAGDIWNDPLD